MHWFSWFFTICSGKKNISRINQSPAGPYFTIRYLSIEVTLWQLPAFGYLHSVVSSLNSNHRYLHQRALSHEKEVIPQGNINPRSFPFLSHRFACQLYHHLAYDYVGRINYHPS